MARDFEKWLKKEPEVVEIDGVQIKIPVLGSDVMHLVVKASSKDEVKQAQGLNGLVDYVLRYNFPDIKPEELKQIDIKIRAKIAEAIATQLQ